MQRKPLTNKTFKIKGKSGKKPTRQIRKRQELIRGILKDRLPKVPESGAMASALIASIGEGLIIVDQYGHISQINQHALDILGYERHEMLGEWLPKAVPFYDKSGKRLPNTNRPVTRALLTGKPVTEVSNYKRKDGTLVPVRGTASPFLIKQKPQGAIIIFRDISREMQVERAKDEFVSLASHQLRTPLTSIRMFTELLKDTSYGELSPKQLDYLDKILFSTEKMIDLVTDLLNISRLNLGRLRVEPEPTNINDLIRIRVEEIQPLADSSNIKLKFISHVSKDEKLPLDRNLLAQVVHNLLSNAIRYSPPKKGRVTARLERMDKYYQLEVADNGIGIPASAKGRIYERFFRADNAVKTHGDGTGLGLYLVKEIITISGGRTWFESQVDKDTSFYVTIPLKGMRQKAKR